ncbi:MAG: hypothetical protein Q8O76_04800 [Chloroflexota bacterium]|nr:hypothetical protein [Chloroflexota bacterium]
MSEWLAKPRLSEEDIRKAQPSLVKYFPMLTRYFVDDQKMRVTVVFDHDKADKFKAAVTKVYGFFGPSTIHKAADEALDAWLRQHS